MQVQLAYPGATSQQIEAHLRASFPRYTVTSRAGMALVGDGAATGVLVKPSGPGQVTLVWAFPSMGTQIAISLSIVLTGILPGLIIFGIVWLSVKSGVERLRQEVGAVLAGGAAPTQAALPVGTAAPGVQPGWFNVAGAVACFLMGVLGVFTFGLVRMGGPGLFDLLFWIVAGASVLMIHAEEKRAFETRTPRSGPGRMVLGVAAILHALLSLSFVFSMEGLYFVRGLFGALFWLASGGLLIAAQTRKTPMPGKQVAPALIAAGAFLVLLGLFAFYDVYDLLDRGVDFSIFVVMAIVRGVLWLVLGAAAFARSAAMRKVPESAAEPVPQPQAYVQQAAYPQQAYPQQAAYPQQGYPQQGYPQQQPPSYPQQGQWPERKQ